MEEIIIPDSYDKFAQRISKTFNSLGGDSILDTNEVKIIDGVKYRKLSRGVVEKHESYDKKYFFTFMDERPGQNNINNPVNVKQSDKLEFEINRLFFIQEAFNKESFIFYYFIWVYFVYKSKGDILFADVKAFDYCINKGKDKKELLKPIVLSITSKDSILRRGRLENIAYHVKNLNK